MKTDLKSCFYTGWVNHTRYQPKHHTFNYPVFMVYLDLDELEAVFRKSWFWSLNRFNLASFHRRDYFGDNSLPLDKAVRNLVEEKTGKAFTGRIRILTNLRYFGFIMNPITCYYCFNEQEQLEYVVAEVTNTPWRERTAYVLPCNGKEKLNTTFGKEMHVSPFMPMDIKYHWQSNTPEQALGIQMQNIRDEDTVFNASLRMKKRPLSTRTMNFILIKYPLMTIQVGLGIYWQALKLWLKKVPLYSNPHHSKIDGQFKDKSDQMGNL